LIVTYRDSSLVLAGVGEADGAGCRT